MSLNLQSCALQRLRASVESEDFQIDLAEAALDLASLALNEKSKEPYKRHLETLYAEVAAFAGPAIDARGCANALGQIIAKRYGYGGTEETFDDPGAANLMNVIDGRSGLPVALGILYIQAARRLGWRAVGVDFPGRFMVRLDVDGERVILNPFDGGRVMEPRDLRDILKLTMGNEQELHPHHYQALDNRGILLRLENNLKVRHLHSGNIDAALEVIETMLLLAPDNAALWREAGMIHVKLDHTAQAIEALEEYMRLDTGGASRYTASVLLQELRSRLL